jgi:hypothetical protein
MLKLRIDQVEKSKVISSEVGVIPDTDQLIFLFKTGTAEE